MNCMAFQEEGVGGKCAPSCVDAPPAKQMVPRLRPVKAPFLAQIDFLPSIARYIHSNIKTGLEKSIG